MNNRLKLDTTVLQSNTSMHLIQYIIEQRNAINTLLHVFSNKWVMSKIKETDLTASALKELNEDFEYIMKKHADALHKRCGTNIYPKNNGYKGGLDTKDSWTAERIEELYNDVMPKEDK